MRLKGVLTAIAVAFAGMAVSVPVKAVDLHLSGGRARPTIDHAEALNGGHIIRANHFQSYRAYQDADPYAYRYEPRGYYPYYDSHYWRRPRAVHRPYLLPPYYQAWGYPRRWEHREWHNQNHGRIRPWHW
jgi:hypothetical protein